MPGGKLSYSFYSGQNLLENVIKHCLPVFSRLNLDWLYYKNNNKQEKSEPTGREYDWSLKFNGDPDPPFTTPELIYSLDQWSNCLERLGLNH